MRFNIKPFLGDTVFLRVGFTLDGSPFDLTGSTVIFTAKEDEFSEDDDSALVQLITDDGITHGSGAEAHIAEIYLASAVTATFPPNTKVYADVQVRTADGDIFTAATGTLFFKTDVTKRTTV